MTTVVTASTHLRASAWGSRESSPLALTQAFEKARSARTRARAPWVAHTRLAELSDVDVDHTWLWRLNPHHGPTLEPEEYVDLV